MQLQFYSNVWRFQWTGGRLTWALMRSFNEKHRACMRATKLIAVSQLIWHQTGRSRVPFLHRQFIIQQYKRHHRLIRDRFVHTMRPRPCDGNDKHSLHYNDTAVNISKASTLKIEYAASRNKVIVGVTEFLDWKRYGVASWLGCWRAPAAHLGTANPLTSAFGQWQRSYGRIVCLSQFIQTVEPSYVIVGRRSAESGSGQVLATTSKWVFKSSAIRNEASVILTAHNSNAKSFFLLPLSSTRNWGFCWTNSIVRGDDTPSGFCTQFSYCLTLF